MKKKSGIPLIIFACLLILGSGYFIFKAAQKPIIPPPPTNIPNHNTIYSYLKTEENKIRFFSTTSGKIIELEAYKCKSVCSIFNKDENGVYFSETEGITFISEEKDGDKEFLYDIKTGTRISDYYSSHSKLSLGNFEDEVRNFVVKGYYSKKMGIIDLNGKVMIPLQYESLGYMNQTTKIVSDYSYGLDYIIAKKAGKWGIVTLSEGKEILPFEFDDVKDYNGHYAMIKIDSKWYIYDILKQVKQSEMGYDYISLFEEFAVVVNDKLLDIIDYSGVSLLKNKAETYVDFARDACCSNPAGISTTLIEGKLRIYLDRKLKDLPAYETIQYEFDLQTKELVLIQP